QGPDAPWLRGHGLREAREPLPFPIDPPFDDETKDSIHGHWQIAPGAVVTPCQDTQLRTISDTVSKNGAAANEGHNFPDSIVTGRQRLNADERARREGATHTCSGNLRSDDFSGTRQKSSEREKLLFARR